MKRGRFLELVVASLEKVLCDKPGVRVFSPYLVGDKTNVKHRRKREHDVVIIHEATHHRLIIALECRDRSRPVTREHVEAFSRKCQDTGIHKGAIVSPSGFRKTAQEKAEFLEIECLTLEAVEQFEWLHTSEISNYDSVLISHKWTFYPEVGVGQKLKLFVVLCETGSEVSKEILEANVIKAWNQNNSHIVGPGVYPFRVTCELPGWKLLDSLSGLEHKLSRAVVSAQFEVVQLPSVRLHKFRYSREKPSTQVAEAAIAPIETGIGNFDLVMMNKEGGLQISIVPTPKSP